MDRILIKNNQLIDDVHIIKAEMKHFDSMLELFLQAANWLKALGLRQWRHFLDGYGHDDIMASINTGTALLIVRDEEVIGTVTVQLTPDEWDTHIWRDQDLEDSVFLHRLVLKRSETGKELGRIILKWIESNLEYPINKKFIKLDCVGDNSKLNQYYISNEYSFLGATEDGHSKYQKEINK